MSTKDNAQHKNIVQTFSLIRLKNLKKSKLFVTLVFGEKLIHEPWTTSLKNIYTVWVKNMATGLYESLVGYTEYSKKNVLNFLKYKAIIIFTYYNRLLQDT